MHWLYPVVTGRTLFDVWSLVHFAFWFFGGSVAWSLAGQSEARRWVALAICMGVALAWEVFERAAEVTWPQLWLNPESFLNAWVSDPLMCFLGVLAVWYALDTWR